MPQDPKEVAKHYFDKGDSGVKIKKILKGKFPDLKPFELREIIRNLHSDDRAKHHKDGDYYYRRKLKK